MGVIDVELSNGLCSISLAITELEIQSSRVELSDGLCSISLAIPQLEIQSSKVELYNNCHPTRTLVLHRSSGRVVVSSLSLSLSSSWCSLVRCLTVSRIM